MKWDRLSRRHLLQGAGAALALPALTSLLPREVEANVMGAPVQKSFIGVFARNGCYRMYGPDSELMPKTEPQYTDPALFQWGSFTSLPGFVGVDLPGKHRIHHQSLIALAAANGGKISENLDASFTSMLPKMNLLQGFNYLWSASHHHAGHFGNAASSGGPFPAMPNIDSVMACSNGFYKDPGLKGRQVNYSCEWRDATQYSSGATYADPSNKVSGGVVKTTAYFNPTTLWDRFFGAAPTTPLKTSLVDRVYEDYRALRALPRLGAADRQRLDRHLTLLTETQQKVRATVPMCMAPQRPPDLSERRDILRAMNSIVVSLIACGHCHAFMGWANSILNNDYDSYHTWSHAGYRNDDDTRGWVNAVEDPVSYANLLQHNQIILKDMCLDLATKLDANGLLDSSLVLCIQEHSRRGHEPWNIPAFTFGSAAGALTTGRYLDYRDFTSGDDCVYTRKIGHPVHQLLATALRAMDVEPAEFEPLNQTPAGAKWRFKAGSGYGCQSNEFDAWYPHWAGTDLSEWLPLLHA